MTTPPRTTFPHTNQNLGNDDTQEDVENANQQPEGSTPMKQKRRAQILAIAEKEEKDYEQYKESKRLLNVSETPSATGGAVSREEVLKRYENQIKSEKYRAKVKRDTYKEEQKMVEEKEINAKKDTARKQAEKNALIEKQHLEDQRKRNADETRRNRLKYFDKANTETNNQSSDEKVDYSPSNTKINTSRNSQCNSSEEASYSASNTKVNTSRNSSCNSSEKVSHSAPTSKINTSRNSRCNSEKVTDIASSPSKENFEIPDIETINRPKEDDDVPSSNDDAIFTLIGMFPDLDVQLLHDVYMSQEYNLEKTINFFQ